MKILGITGKIGSGKTTAVDIIKNKYNVRILNLDDIAKIIIKEKKIEFKLVEDSFLSSKDLNFVKSTIHPIVWDKVKKEIKNLNNISDIDFVIIETALPSEVFFDICDNTICIDSKKNIELLKSNRDYNDKRIKMILEEQKQYEAFYKLCDKFINNDYDKKEFINVILDSICEIYIDKSKNKTKIVSIRSSSEGNCTFISNGNKNILVDCGISIKTLNECLCNYDLTLDDIDAIFITHKHSDHIKSIETILSKYRIKIFGLKETLLDIYNYLINKNISVDTKLFYPLHIQNNFSNSYSVKIDDNMKVKYCEAYHDVPCIFYKFYIENLTFAILTDCGMFDSNIINFLLDVNYLMLECNYDIEMLTKNTNYPDYLKKRIAGTKGHMSNVDCTRLIYEIANDKLKLVCLSHISKNNNTEEFAYRFVTEYLNELNVEKKKLPKIITASRVRETRIY